MGLVRVPLLSLVNVVFRTIRPGSHHNMRSNIRLVFELLFHCHVGKETRKSNVNRALAGLSPY